eukprot:15463285-Alexandrium_andersonii.AAC.1
METMPSRPGRRRAGCGMVWASSGLSPAYPASIARTSSVVSRWCRKALCHIVRPCQHRDADMTHEGMYWCETLGRMGTSHGPR